MNLEEAIQHLEETLSDDSHNWGCKSCKDEHKQLLNWLKELRETRQAKQHTQNETQKLIERLRENAEWADEAGEWEIPLDMPDVMREAADLLENVTNEIERVIEADNSPDNWNFRNGLRYALKLLTGSTSDFGHEPTQKQIDEYAS